MMEEPRIETLVVSQAPPMVNTTLTLDSIEILSEQLQTLNICFAQGMGTRP